MIGHSREYNDFTIPSSASFEYGIPGILGIFALFIAPIDPTNTLGC